MQIVGASPEILVRNETVNQGKGSGRKVTIRPLAGTRPRGATPERDAELAEELLADPKEIAEHVMLIALARNDIGRIAEIGSVRVTDKFVIEKYSHVQHIVSNVEGILKPGLSNLDVLNATFPAGTLSGAIKDGMLYVQAAAGIVADSVPEMEWQETENKARAVLRAAEQVQDGLDGGI